VNTKFLVCQYINSISVSPRDKIERRKAKNDVCVVWTEKLTSPSRGSVPLYAIRLILKIMLLLVNTITYKIIFD